MHTCCSTNQHFSYHCYSTCQRARIRRTGARDLSLHLPRLHNAVALTWMLDISSVAPWRCRTGSVRSRSRTYRFGGSFTSFRLIWSASCVCMCVCVEGGEIKRGAVWMCACGCVHVRRGRGAWMWLWLWRDRINSQVCISSHPLFESYHPQQTSWLARAHGWWL